MDGSTQRAFSQIITKYGIQSANSAHSAVPQFGTHIIDATLFMSDPKSAEGKRMWSELPVSQGVGCLPKTGNQR